MSHTVLINISITLHNVIGIWQKSINITHNQKKAAEPNKQGPQCSKQLSNNIRAANDMLIELKKNITQEPQVMSQYSEQKL